MTSTTTFEREIDNLKDEIRKLKGEPTEEERQRREEAEKRRFELQNGIGSAASLALRQVADARHKWARDWLESCGASSDSPDDLKTTLLSLKGEREQRAIAELVAAAAGKPLSDQPWLRQITNAWPGLSPEAAKAVAGVASMVDQLVQVPLYL